MYDDFYYAYEHSYFDEQIEEFKDGLRKTVKKEFLNEMEKLKKENQELQEVAKDNDYYQAENKHLDAALTGESLVSSERKEKLEQAKEIIKNLLNYILTPEGFENGEVIKQAEQFLNSEVEK